MKRNGICKNMKKEDREQFFKKFNYTRLCCKRMYLSAVNFQDELFQYENARRYFKC